MVLNSCSTEINQIKQDLTKKEKPKVFYLLLVHCNLTLTVKNGGRGRRGTARGISSSSLDGSGKHFPR